MKSESQQYWSDSSESSATIDSSDSTEYSEQKTQAIAHRVTSRKDDRASVYKKYEGITELENLVYSLEEKYNKLINSTMNQWSKFQPELIK